MLVTHQLQYLPQADVILVLEGGRLAACGSYHQLTAQGVQFHQFQGMQEGPGAGLAAPAVAACRACLHHMQHSSAAGHGEADCSIVQVRMARTQLTHNRLSSSPWTSTRTRQCRRPSWPQCHQASLCHPVGQDHAAAHSYLHAAFPLKATQNQLASLAALHVLVVMFPHGSLWHSCPLGEASSSAQVLSL